MTSLREKLYFDDSNFCQNIPSSFRHLHLSEAEIYIYAHDVDSAGIDLPVVNGR